MDAYVVVWGLGGGAVSLNLTDGRQVVPVFEQEAGARMFAAKAIAAERRGIAITCFTDVTKSALKRRIESALAKSGPDMSMVVVVFESAPVFDALFRDLPGS